MKASEEVMGTFGKVFVSFVVLISSVSLSESKRSACWRYGHSCWGGHGKRSGAVGEGISSLVLPSKVTGDLGLLGSGTGIAGTPSSGDKLMFGILDKGTGRFVPFPVLSMMMRNRDWNPHSFPPVVRGGGGKIMPTLMAVQPSGQRSVGIMNKIKRSGNRLLRAGSESGSDDLNQRNDNSAQEREAFVEDEETASGSLDQSISKEEPNRSEKMGEYESADDFASNGSSQSSERQVRQSNDIFVRDRKGGLTGTSQSNEKANSANEEESQEGSSLPKLPPRFFLKTMLRNG